MVMLEIKGKNIVKAMNKGEVNIISFISSLPTENKKWPISAMLWHLYFYFTNMDWKLTAL